MCDRSTCALQIAPLLAHRGVRPPPACRHPRPAGQRHPREPGLPRRCQRRSAAARRLRVLSARAIAACGHRRSRMARSSFATSRSLSRPRASFAAIRSSSEIARMRRPNSSTSMAALSTRGVAADQHELDAGLSEPKQQLLQIAHASPVRHVRVRGRGSARPDAAARAAHGSAAGCRRASRGRCRCGGRFRRRWKVPAWRKDSAPPARRRVVCAAHCAVALTPGCRRYR